MSIASQLKNVIARLDLKLNSAAKDIMEEVKEQLKESTEVLWYSRTPKDYNRTYELIDSINGRIVKNGIGNYTIEVFYDEKLVSYGTNSKGWNTHAGFDGRDFRSGLIESIAYGTIKGSGNNPRKGESPQIYDAVLKEATKIANNILKRYI